MSKEKKDRIKVVGVKKIIFTALLVFFVQLFLFFYFYNCKTDNISPRCDKHKIAIHSKVSYTFYAKGCYIIKLFNNKEEFECYCYDYNFDEIVKGDSVVKEKNSLDLTIYSFSGDTFYVSGKK